MADTGSWDAAAAAAAMPFAAESALHRGRCELARVTNVSTNVHPRLVMALCLALRSRARKKFESNFRVLQRYVTLGQGLVHVCVVRLVLRFLEGPPSRHAMIFSDLVRIIMDDAFICDVCVGSGLHETMQGTASSTVHILDSLDGLHERARSVVGHHKAAFEETDRKERKRLQKSLSRTESNVLEVPLLDEHYFTEENGKLIGDVPEARVIAELFYAFVGAACDAASPEFASNVCHAVLGRYVYEAVQLGVGCGAAGVGRGKLRRPLTYSERLVRKLDMRDVPYEALFVTRTVEFVRHVAQDSVSVVCNTVLHNGLGTVYETYVDEEYALDVQRAVEGSHKNAAAATATATGRKAGGQLPRPRRMSVSGQHNLGYGGSEANINRMVHSASQTLIAFHPEWGTPSSGSRRLRKMRRYSAEVWRDASPLVSNVWIYRIEESSEPPMRTASECSDLSVGSGGGGGDDVDGLRFFSKEMGMGKTFGASVQCAAFNVLAAIAWLKD